MTPTLILRLWLAVGAILVIGVLMWELAPILYVMVPIAAGLGAIAYGMVRLARLIERRRQEPNGGE